MNFLNITLLSIICCTVSHAFTPSIVTRYSTSCHRTLLLGDSRRSFMAIGSTSKEQKDKGILDVITMKVDIPDEVRDEIFKAEANTSAAKDRNARVALYAIIAILGVAISSLNFFLSNVRESAGASASDLSSIADVGFGWVGSNPLSSFFLLNKIGGGIALIAAGFGGTMVELEQRTKNENAEKIWKELQRRRLESNGRPNRNVSSTEGAKKKKQKNKKRLEALSEVILEDDEKEQQQINKKVPTTSLDNQKETSVLGKIKNLYDEADKMAASQALLLNKELEDLGVLEKITDESGLNVIGKEAASKLKDRKKNDE
mmetsp:Transcript_16687/g.31614  ORF Transcript_16687/g.31614 Transcript_16687/m.31614 type:complete len:316 (+) Transcript_16687:147-1094(+)